MVKQVECCPIAQLFDMLGKKRMILLIKTLGESEFSSFSDLQKKMNNINSRILTERLDEGVATGYIIRNVSTNKPLKITYFLTLKGKKLATKIQELCVFAEESNS